jgi:fatty-acyl-CoA synthase
MAQHAGGSTSMLQGEATFVDLALWALARFPDSVAFIEDGGPTTYREALDAISRYAQELSDRGYGPGEGLVVLSGNRADALLCGLAVRALGAWSSALHPLGSTEDQAFILQDSGARGLVFDPTRYEAQARAIAALTPDCQMLSLGPADIGEDLNAAASKQTAGPVTSVAAADDICSLAYSGGTTGRPKGIVQRHRTVVEMTHQVIAGWQLPEAIRFLAASPISHAASVFVLPTWMNGGTVVLLPGFEPSAFCEAIARHHITLSFMVPTMLYALLDHPCISEADLSSVETILYGAAPIAPNRLQRALEVFGPVFVQLYGQAEAPATVTVLRKEEHDPARLHLLASCGKPCPGVTVTLMDEEDQEVAMGEVGEICVRGRIVADGYWNRPELTAETLRNEWLHTGDMARRDVDGYLYIVDRKKDMIISGGFNVYPREVEDVLNAHEQVVMAAVVGIPDDRWGEAVHALVVLRPGSELTADELIALVRERKGPVYAPKSIDVVEALPLTGIGKPDRKLIRSRYWTAQERAVH